MPVLPWNLSSGPSVRSAGFCSFLFPLLLPIWWFLPFLKHVSLRQHQLGKENQLHPVVGLLGLAGTICVQHWASPASPHLYSPWSPNLATAVCTQPGMAHGGAGNVSLSGRKAEKLHPCCRFWGAAQQGLCSTEIQEIAKLIIDMVCLWRSYFGSQKFCICHLYVAALPTL